MKLWHRASKRLVLRVPMTQPMSLGYAYAYPERVPCVTINVDDLRGGSYMIALTSREIDELVQERDRTIGYVTTVRTA